MLLRRIFPDAIVGLLAGLALAASFFFTVIAVDSSQRDICHRQQRASVAVPYLINAMDDIHRLITFPPSKSEAKRQKELPPHEMIEEKQVVQALTDNLQTFVHIEHSLPPQHC